MPSRVNAWNTSYVESESLTIRGRCQQKGTVGGRGIQGRAASGLQFHLALGERWRGCHTQRHAEHQTDLLIGVTPL